MTANAPRTSEILTGLLAAQSSTHSDLLRNVTVGELLAALRNRAFGLSFLLFGLPNILPIPGLPIICGLVLTILAVQVAFGRDVPWLPPALANWEVSRAALASIINRSVPWVSTIERFSRPRFAAATSPLIRRVVGLVVLVLAILLIVLPIPWIGSLPQGLAICLFGLGLTERDGVIVTVGFIVSGLALAVGAAIAVALWYGVNLIF